MDMEYFAVKLDLLNSLKKERSLLEDNKTYLLDAFTVGDEEMFISLQGTIAPFSDKIALDSKLLYRAFREKLLDLVDSRLKEINVEIKNIDEHFWEVA